MPENEKITSHINSKLIATLAGVISITAMAIAGVVSGGVAVPVIVSMVGGYIGYRQVYKVK